MDIQGLRAVAVLIVVAYHARLPIPGGFTGVDVFFVISGFVIAQSLYRESAKGTKVSLSRFYARRFWRLAPALGLLVGTTLILSALLLSPLGAQQTAAQTAFAATLSFANAAIFLTSGNYFDAPAEGNPLLHTWSLSVEEQFYLAAPILLVLAWRAFPLHRHRRLALAMSVTVTGASLALVLLPQPLPWLPFSDFLTGFYGPLGRVWEFTAGAALGFAIYRHPPLNARLRQVTFGLGGVLLVIACWGIPAGVQYPGPWTLVPVSAALLIILGGSGGGTDRWNPLSTKPLTYLGDRSYSIYLWHWPLIVFALVVWPDGRWTALIAAAVSFLPALFAYRWWEMPLRYRYPRSSMRFFLLAGTVVLVPLLMARGLLYLADSVWKPAFATSTSWVVHPGDTGSESFFEELRDRYSPCVDRDILRPAPVAFDTKRCFQSSADESLTVALLGDSHAEHLFPGLAELLPDENIGYLLTDRPDQDASSVDDAVSLVADRPSIHTVVLGGWWANPDLGPVDGAKLEEVVTRVTGSGKRVVLTDDVPSFPLDVDRCKYRFGVLLEPRCSVSSEAFKFSRRTYIEALESAARIERPVTLIETAALFCNDEECNLTLDGTLAFRDQNHLNVAGSRAVATTLVDSVTSETTRNTQWEASLQPNR